MQRIPFTSIRIGERLGADLYDHRGRLLLRAGYVVKDRHLAVARTLVRNDLYIDEQPDPEPPPTIPQSPGIHNHWTIDDQGQISAASDVSRRLDEAVLDGTLDDAVPAADPMPLDPPLDLARLRKNLPQDCHRYRASINTYSQAAERLLGQGVDDVDAVSDALDRLQQSLGNDRTLGLLAIELQQTDEEYLFHHGVNVATLTMLVAARMGFRQDQVLEAGLGSMFHDLGMLKVPADIRMTRGPLSGDQRLQIRRHPIITVNCLERVDAVGLTALMVAYQVHERCDGTGYPRGRRTAAIHPLSRIAAVTDTFVAWSSWRPHRKALPPYEAILRVLQGVKSGWFDRTVVRALLDCISLCPVGSFVRLSTGETAKVLRSNGSDHTRPVVVTLDENGVESDRVLDLAGAPRTRIVAPADPPAHAAAA